MTTTTTISTTAKIIKQHQQLALTDFSLVCTLGTGTFGKVLLVKLNKTHHQQHYALKVLSKTQVVSFKQVEHVNSEKDLLAFLSNRPSSPYAQFYVSLLATFQDHKNLYMLQEFVSGGELFSHLRKAGRFSPDVARFYAANVLLALEGLHQLDIIYRDLKPENLLLALNGYLKLTDFGFAKKVPDRTWTLCGTPEYLAPEIIQSKGHGKPADWWAFGILLFEMLAGHPPFFNSDNSPAAGPFPIYEKILQCHLQFPLPPANKPPSTTPNGFDIYSVHLISSLLVLDRSKRLGNLKGGILDIKNHLWFHGVDWHLLIQQAIPVRPLPPSVTSSPSSSSSSDLGYQAPILPKISNPGDSSNFDRYPNVSLDDLPGFHNPQPTTTTSPTTSAVSPTSSPSCYQHHLAPQYSLNHNGQSSSHDPFRHLFDSF